MFLISKKTQCLNVCDSEREFEVAWSETRGLGETSVSLQLTYVIYHGHRTCIVFHKDSTIIRPGVGDLLLALQPPGNIRELAALSGQVFI